MLAGAKGPFDLIGVEGVGGVDRDDIDIRSLEQPIEVGGRKKPGVGGFGGRSLARIEVAPRDGAAQAARAEGDEQGVALVEPDDPDAESFLEGALAIRATNTDGRATGGQESRVHR